MYIYIYIYMLFSLEAGPGQSLERNIKGSLWQWRSKDPGPFECRMLVSAITMSILDPERAKDYWTRSFDRGHCLSFRVETFPPRFDLASLPLIRKA